MSKSSGGFVATLLDKANEFTRIAYKQIAFNKKVMGTKVQVSRTTEDNKYKSVYGTLYNSSLVGTAGKSSFEYVVLINMNDMKKLYQRNIEQLEFYDNEQVLQMGDVITYSRNSREFKFKIINIETWSDDENVIYKYTISGLSETNTQQNENCQNTNKSSDQSKRSNNNCDWDRQTRRS